MSHRSLRVLLFIAIATFALLRSPVIFVEFESDDLLILQVLEGIEPSSMASRGPLDLYRFFDGNPEEARRRMALGDLPWWFDTEKKTGHFRPLTSALLWLDHALFGLDPLGPHAHSLGWFVLLGAAAALLFTRILPGPQSVLALLILGLSSHSLVPTAWWAARHGLVSAVMGVLALLAHVRWREDGWKPGLALSLAGLSLSLLAGETGLQCFAYFVAYALVGERARMGKRLRSIVPAVGFVIAYLSLRFFLDYGVTRSGIYIDPLRAPIDYAANVFRNLPSTLAELLLQVDVLRQSFPLTRIPGGGGTLGAVAVIALAGLVIMARGSWTRDEARRLGWVTAGTALSLLLCFARRDHVIPWTLLLPGVGASMLLAALLHRAIAVWGRSGVVGRTGLAAAGALFCFCQIVYPAFITPVALQWLTSRDPFTILPDEEVLGGEVRDVVILRAQVPVPRGLFVLGGIGSELHAAWTISAPMGPSGGLRITRAADEVLVLETAIGSLLPLRDTDFFRDHRRYPISSRAIRLEGLEIEIEKHAGLAVLRAKLRFTQSADEARYAFLVQRGETLRRVPVPPVGESAYLPGPLDPGGPGP